VNYLAYYNRYSIELSRTIILEEYEPSPVNSNIFFSQHNLPHPEDQFHRKSIEAIIYFFSNILTLPKKISVRVSQVAI
jgi:hypothetical protein